MMTMKRWKINLVMGGQGKEAKIMKEPIKDDMSDAIMKCSKLSLFFFTIKLFSDTLELIEAVDNKGANKNMEAL